MKRLRVVSCAGSDLAAPGRGDDHDGARHGLPARLPLGQEPPGEHSLRNLLPHGSDGARPAGGLAPDVRLTPSLHTSR